MRRISKRGLVAIGVGVTLMAAAGGAYAYWTQSGSGTATGTAGTTGNIVVTGTIAPGIYPTGTRPVTFTAANSGDSASFLDGIHLVSVSTSAVGCAVDAFSMPDILQSHSVPGHATVEALPNGGTLTMADNGLNQDLCKSATITLTLSTT